MLSYKRDPSNLMFVGVEQIEVFFSLYTNIFFLGIFSTILLLLVVLENKYLTLNLLWFGSYKQSIVF